MSTELQRRGFKQKGKLTLMFALLFAACALLTQCTTGANQTGVSGNNDSSSPEITTTAEPTATPQPTATPNPTSVPEPTATPIPSDWYIDESGHIPTDVKMLMQPSCWGKESYCLTRNEEGKLVCQRWAKQTLKKEWILPEEMLEVGGLKEMYINCYTDPKDGEEVFNCILQHTFTEYILGPEQEQEVAYIYKAGKGLLVVYDSFVMDFGMLSFVTTDDELIQVTCSKYTTLQSFSWKLEEGCYIDYDNILHCHTVYDKNGTKIGKILPKDHSGEYNDNTTFYEPLDKPSTPEWFDVEE